MHIKNKLILSEKQTDSVCVYVCYAYEIEKRDGRWKKKKETSATKF
jgi:hypothetical protein